MVHKTDLEHSLDRGQYAGTQVLADGGWAAKASEEGGMLRLGTSLAISSWALEHKRHQQSPLRTSTEQARQVCQLLIVQTCRLPYIRTQRSPTGASTPPAPA